MQSLLLLLLLGLGGLSGHDLLELGKLLQLRISNLETRQRSKHRTLGSNLLDRLSWRLVSRLAAPDGRSLAASSLLLLCRSCLRLVHSLLLSWLLLLGLPSGSIGVKVGLLLLRLGRWLLLLFFLDSLLLTCLELLSRSLVGRLLLELLLALTALLRRATERMVLTDKLLAQTRSFLITSLRDLVGFHLILVLGLALKWLLLEVLNGGEVLGTSISTWIGESGERARQIEQVLGVDGTASVGLTVAVDARSVQVRLIEHHQNVVLSLTNNSTTVAERYVLTKSRVDVHDSVADAEVVHSLLV